MRSIPPESSCSSPRSSSFLLYWRSFTSPFVYDDLDGIVNNPNLTSWSDFSHRFLLRPVALTSSLLSHAGFTYRPLFWLTLFLDRAIWGLNAGGFHAANLALHFLNGNLAFLLLRRLKLPLLHAAAIALLWARPPHQHRSRRLGKRPGPMPCAQSSSWPAFWPLRTTSVAESQSGPRPVSQPPPARSSRMSSESSSFLFSFCSLSLQGRSGAQDSLHPSQPSVSPSPGAEALRFKVGVHTFSGLASARWAGARARSLRCPDTPSRAHERRALHIHRVQPTASLAASCSSHLPPHLHLCRDLPKNNTRTARGAWSGSQSAVRPSASCRTTRASRSASSTSPPLAW